MEKVCEVCGELFKTYPCWKYKRRTCSKKCQADLLRKAPIKARCEHCSKEFTYTRNRLRGQRFCSIECANKSRITRVTKRCYLCGKSFSVEYNKRQVTKYCCEAHSGLARRKVQRPTKEQLQLLVQQISIAKVGELYGMSASGIRRWCANMGVEIPTKEERAMWKNSRKSRRYLR
jgi:hypothetical protein